MPRPSPRKKELRRSHLLLKAQLKKEPPKRLSPPAIQEKMAAHRLLQYQGYRKKRYQKVLRKAARYVAGLFRWDMETRRSEALLQEKTLIVPTRKYRKAFGPSGGNLSRIPEYQKPLEINGVPGAPGIDFKDQVVFPESRLHSNMRKEVLYDGESALMHEYVHLMRSTLRRGKGADRDSEIPTHAVDFSQRLMKVGAGKDLASVGSREKERRLELLGRRRSSPDYVRQASLGMDAGILAEGLRRDFGEKTRDHFLSQVCRMSKFKWKKIAALEQEIRADRKVEREKRFRA